MLPEIIFDTGRGIRHKQKRSKFAEIIPERLSCVVRAEGKADSRAAASGSIETNRPQSSGLEIVSLGLLFHKPSHTCGRYTCEAYCLGWLLFLEKGCWCRSQDVSVEKGSTDGWERCRN